MKKLFLLIAAFFLIAGETKAQIITNGDCVRSNVNASFFRNGFKIGYEQRVGRFFSLSGNVGMLPYNWDYSFTLGEYAAATVSTWCIELEPRYYFNYERRARLGKSTQYNSADFVAMKIGVMPLAGVPVISPYYGIRRAFNKHIYNELALGLNFYFILPLPLIQYRIGISF